LGLLLPSFSNIVVFLSMHSLPKRFISFSHPYSFYDLSFFRILRPLARSVDQDYPLFLRLFLIKRPSTVEGDLPPSPRPYPVFSFLAFQCLLLLSCYQSVRTFFEEDQAHFMPYFHTQEAEVIPGFRLPLMQREIRLPATFRLPFPDFFVFPTPFRRANCCSAFPSASPGYNKPTLWRHCCHPDCSPLENTAPVRPFSVHGSVFTPAFPDFFLFYLRRLLRGFFNPACHLLLMKKTGYFPPTRAVPLFSACQSAIASEIFS